MTSIGYRGYDITALGSDWIITKNGDVEMSLEISRFTLDGVKEILNDICENEAVDEFGKIGGMV